MLAAPCSQVVAGMSNLKRKHYVERQGGAGRALAHAHDR
jgi:hypothetical protein